MQADTDDLLHFASEPPNVVNALNRELWLHDDGTVEARPHDPATGMRHVLNVNYDPGGDLSRVRRGGTSASSKTPSIRRR